MSSDTSFNIKAWIPALIKQDKKAQKIVFYRYYNLVFHTSLRYTKNRMDAEELSNDVFIKLFSRIRKYDEKYNFEAWLYRMTINTAIDKYRRLVNQVKFEEVTDQIQISDTQFDQIFDNEEIQILPLLSELPDRYRIVFNLYVFEEYSHKEISEKLKIPVGTSKSCLSRAKSFILQHKSLQVQLQHIYARRI